MVEIIIEIVLIFLLLKIKSELINEILIIMISMERELRKWSGCKEGVKINHLLVTDQTTLMDSFEAYQPMLQTKIN